MVSFFAGMGKGIALAVVWAMFGAFVVRSPHALADKKSDTLVWATDRENPIADPYYLNTRDLVIIGHHAWDTLVWRDPGSGQIAPLLATRWQWIDDRTLEFELRQGVTFHSGKVLDADDVVYTLDFVTNKDHAVLNFTLLDWIRSAEKVDAKTVRIHLGRPFPPALSYLAGAGFIVPRGHYDGAPTRPDGRRDYGAVKPNGTGPYRVAEVKPGDSITLVRNEAYFDSGPKGTPAIGTLRMRTIKDQNARIAELLTGGVDWIWEVPKDLAERLRKNPAIVVDEGGTLRVGYLAFDVRGTSDTKQFMDRRVRQAVAHAINRRQIARTVMGDEASVIHAACHPKQFGCSAGVVSYDYDPRKARALLTEAGYPDGFEFDFYAFRDREQSEAIIGDLTRAGLKPRLTYLQYTAFLEASRKGRVPLGASTWGSNSIADVSAITAKFFTGGPDDVARDETVITGIAQADAQIDPARRRLLWEKVLDRIATEVYWVPLWTYSKYYAFSKDLDFKPTADEIPQFFAAKWR